MAYQINIEKQAEKDLLLAICHFKTYDLDQKFIIDFNKQLYFLKANPYLFQLYYKRIRKIHLQQFNYSIHFIIKNEQVFILRILHQRQFENS